MGVNRIGKVRITSSGAMSFILNYRANGRARRLTIGSYPDWSVQAAREEARDLRRKVDRGGDPMGDRHEARAAPTVAELAQRYLEEHAQRKRESSRLNDRLLLEKHILPRLGAVKVQNLQHRDIEALHRALCAHPYQANRVVALLSKMLSLAVKWGMRSDNPAKGIERYPEEKRERFLSPDELQRLKQPVEKGVIDRVSRHGEAYRGEGGFAILRDDEDDLNDQDGSSGRNKHEQGANSARHGLLRGAGADELAHQQR